MQHSVYVTPSKKSTCEAIQYSNVLYTVDLTSDFCLSIFDTAFSAFSTLLVDQLEKA